MKLTWTKKYKVKFTEDDMNAIYKVIEICEKLHEELDENGIMDELEEALTNVEGTLYDFVDFIDKSPNTEKPKLQK